MKKEPFEALDEARHKAGFLMSEACEFLCIEKRTWYRWKAKNECPKWAVEAMKIRSGDLAALGWEGWFLKQGVLYTEVLDSKYYKWRPENLLEEAFWRANGMRQKGAAAIRETRNISILDIRREQINKVNQEG